MAGLVTARALREQGHDVIVLEASDRVGGQIHTVDWHGLRVDVGAEAMFLGGPHLKQLVNDLGLTNNLVTPVRGSSWLYRDGTLTPLPEGVGPTGPTKLTPVLKSGLLSPLALARAGLEPLLARRKVTEDISVGAFITRRFGRAVAETFVDPLLGNLHAGDIDRLSLFSTAPQLAPLAREGRSLVWKKSTGKKAAAGSPNPVATPATSTSTPVPAFASFAGGLQTLVNALAHDLVIKRLTPAKAARRTPHGWDITTPNGSISAQRLVIAAPAAVAGRLLEATVPGIGAELTTGPTADVATVLLAYPAAAAAGNTALTEANGILLHSGSGRVLKAATFLSRKWAHLHSDEVFVVRASAGRAGSDVLDFVDDDTLADQIYRELAELIALRTRPVDTLVTRWPGAYPQLEVGHASRLERIRTALHDHPVHLVGAPYDGLGMPSVVKSAFVGAS